MKTLKQLRQFLLDSKPAEHKDPLGIAFFGAPEDSWRFALQFFVDRERESQDEKIITFADFMTYSARVGFPYEVLVNKDSPHKDFFLNWQKDSLESKEPGQITESLFSLLVEKLLDPDELIRKSATNALVQLCVKDQNYIAKIILKFNKADLVLKSALAEILKSLAKNKKYNVSISVEVIDELINLLDSRNEYIPAAVILSRLAYAIPEARVKQILDKLMDVISCCKEPVLIANAWLAFGNLIPIAYADKMYKILKDLIFATLRPSEFEIPVGLAKVVGNPEIFAQCSETLTEKEVNFLVNEGFLNASINIRIASIHCVGYLSRYIPNNLAFRVNDAFCQWLALNSPGMRVAAAHAISACKKNFVQARVVNKLLEKFNVGHFEALLVIAKQIPERPDSLKPIEIVYRELESYAKALCKLRDEGYVGELLSREINFHIEKLASEEVETRSAAFALIAALELRSSRNEISFALTKAIKLGVELACEEIIPLSEFFTEQHFEYLSTHIVANLHAKNNFRSLNYYLNVLVALGGVPSKFLEEALTKLATLIAETDHWSVLVRASMAVTKMFSRVIEQSAEEPRTYLTLIHETIWKRIEASEIADEKVLLMSLFYKCQNEALNTDNREYFQITQLYK